MVEHLNGLFHNQFLSTTLNKHHLFVDLDTFWIEKQEGNKEGMTYAEPIGDIHMPNNSFIPFVMAFGLFVGSFWSII